MWNWLKNSLKADKVHNKLNLDISPLRLGYLLFVLKQFALFKIALGWEISQPGKLIQNETVVGEWNLESV